MNDSELRTVIVATLRTIAPEVDGDELIDSKPLRRQVDLDSLDWLNFLVAIHETLGVDIPEADYAQLVTVADLVRYLGARVAA